jgi:hypothetical protein
MAISGLMFWLVIMKTLIIMSTIWQLEDRPKVFSHKKHKNLK